MSRYPILVITIILSQAFINCFSTCNCMIMVISEWMAPCWMRASCPLPIKTFECPVVKIKRYFFVFQDFLFLNIQKYLLSTYRNSTLLQGIFLIQD